MFLILLTEKYGIMITCRLIGRMGNQAFILANLIAYSRKHGQQYCIPKTTIAPHLWQNYFEYISHGCETHLKNPVFIKEKEHHYQELPAPSGNFDYIMEGYWQSYKYFDFCIEEIRTLFDMNTSVITACAVHVRRCDYVTEFPDKHPAVTAEYLDRAIAKVQYMKGNTTFMFFSDDMEWVKEYLKDKSFPYVLMSNSVNEDFRLMTCCLDQIISNSSFSWWAAYLNNNPHKIVITPHEDNWFGPGNSHLSCIDLIPPEWHRIKY